MKHKNLTLAFAVAMALCTSTLLGAALTGGPYAIDPLDVNGGGTRSTGGVYVVTASTAQAGGIGVTAAGAIYRFIDGFWPPAVNAVRLIDSKPADQESLWRSQKNVVRLIFDNDITIPQGGEVLIQEMLTGGAYGPDLSSGFTFTVENDEDAIPRTLRIAEKASSLSHRRWYAIRGVDWSDVLDFTVQYVVQVGDANRDGRVQTSDITVINMAIPTLKAPDDDPRDMDGDGRILNRDAGIANSHIPSVEVPKPSGH